MVTKRLSRSIQLLFLLRRSNGLSLQKIALLLDCSHRTAAADLEALKECGFEVIRTACGYRIGIADEVTESAWEQEGWLSLLETMAAFPVLRSGSSPVCQRNLLPASGADN